MKSELLSRQDLDFMLYTWLQVDELCERPRFADHSRETFDPALDLSERMATEHFAPHLKQADTIEPSLAGDEVTLIPEIGAALKLFSESGFISASMDYDVGGMQLPSVVSSACFAWFQAANTSTAAYALLTTGNANLILAHGSDDQIKRYVGPMGEGRFFGTMCLSETEAGSSLGDIATRAEPTDDGRYRVIGNKMWISAGEHDLSENIVHLVLARIAGASKGVKGLSLFVVPKFLVNDDGSLGERNDVAVTGLNHKMGFRGTTNTVLSFGGNSYQPEGSPGALGTIVGQPGQGLMYMFHMMNEARVGVGLGAAALGYTGYLKSLQYAKDRRQGRLLGAADPSPVAIIEHSDVKRMLLAQKSYVEGAVGLSLYCARLLDDEATHPEAKQRELAALLLGVLTPVAKSWPSQWCLEANSLAIQVHGGYGYTRDYDVEQHYRDNRLNPIHEGTHGIQGLDLLGRKVIMNDGAGLLALTERMRATCDRADSDLEILVKQLRTSISRIEYVTTTLWSTNDVPATLANASIYLEAFGHVVMAWIWLEQLVAVGDSNGAFFDGKRQAANYFFRYELPKTGPQFDLLEAVDRTTLEMNTDWF